MRYTTLFAAGVLTLMAFDASAQTAGKQPTVDNNNKLPTSENELRRNLSIARSPMRPWERRRRFRLRSVVSRPAKRK